MKNSIAHEGVAKCVDGPGFVSDLAPATEAAAEVHIDLKRWAHAENGDVIGRAQGFACSLKRRFTNQFQRRLYFGHWNQQIRARKPKVLDCRPFALNHDRA